jgi:hypothetical protein
VFGIMPSPKLDDLRRDARCVLHSSVSKIDGSEGEFKVHGRAVATEDPAILEAPDTWWQGRRRDRFEAFVVDIDEAILVAWSTDMDRMRTLRWTTAGGATDRERTYP